MVTNTCFRCGATLVPNINWLPGHIKKGDYVCKKCINIRKRELHTINRDQINEKKCVWAHAHGVVSAKDNKTCSKYLGCIIAESVLYNVYNNVVRMPENFSGYDFICGRGYKVDVKASTRYLYVGRSDKWVFTTRRNTIPDYFLCIAFDDREKLNPEHIWLIPNNIGSDKTALTMTESQLTKWEKYELRDKLNEVISCCDVMRGGA